MADIPPRIQSLPDEPLPGVSVVRGPVGTVTVRFFGEVDTFGVPILEAALHAVWDEEPRLVVVDLTRVTFFSISAMNAVLRSRATARRRGLGFAVRTAPGVIVRLLDLAGARDAIEGTTHPVSRPGGYSGRGGGRGRLTVVPELDETAVSAVQS
jgi:anti-anti-sigma factor